MKIFEARDIFKISVCTVLHIVPYKPNVYPTFSSFGLGHPVTSIITDHKWSCHLKCCWNKIWDIPEN